MGEDRGNSLKAKLIQRWKRIEELEGQDESTSNDIEDDFRRMKEQWYTSSWLEIWCKREGRKDGRDVDDECSDSKG